MKTALLGLLLSVATAIGCIAYERVVKQYGIIAIATGKLVEVGLFVVIMYALGFTSIKGLSFFTSPHWWVYVASGITTILWFWITFQGSVALGAVWESSYLPILILLYLFFGAEVITIRFVIGAILVFAGLLCINV